MRLLDTKTLKLHEFFGSAIPPYAILSHMWREGEVSFQEIQSVSRVSRNVTLKAGYEKIRGCCDLAASDGFQYAWVDTCCIDKTSSAELSEAINSMYRWYRVAAVCYVYLSDVDEASNVDAPESAFRRSRWFTRGWTLQELIAPSSLIFFNNQWCELETKTSLGALVSDITGIHNVVLQDASNLAEFCVAQKMSWASKRVTNREEYIAYCLLGLFGVNMPMLYGEGSHAFIRLQEEIIKTTNDHSIFAWSNQLDSFGEGLLAQSPDRFSLSGDISQTIALATHPFTLTNKGIQLRLRMKKLEGTGLYLALLDCRDREGVDNIAIHLVRLFESHDIFERVRSNELGIVNRLQASQFTEQDVFFKYKKPQDCGPDRPNCYVATKGLTEAGILLREAYPTRLQSEDLSQLVLLVSAYDYYSEDGQDVDNHISSLKFADEGGQGFVVLLRFEVNEPPSAAIYELNQFYTRIASLTTQNKEVSLAVLCDSESDFLPDDYYSDRIHWQHPEQGWWINMNIRTILKDGQRAQVAQISWHALEV